MWYRVTHRILVLTKHHGYLNVSYHLGKSTAVRHRAIHSQSRCQKQWLSGRDLRQGQRWWFHGISWGDNRGDFEGTCCLLFMFFLRGGLASGNGHDHNINHINPHKLGYKPCNIVYITTTIYIIIYNIILLWVMFLTYGGCISVAPDPLSTSLRAAV